MSNSSNGPLMGKSVLVTGASRGIGATIAERLAADGARVIVNYVSSADAAKGVVDKIRHAGGMAHAVQADVSHVSDIAPLFATTVKHFGRLDVLVNNAAISEGSSLDEITEEMFDRLVATNLKSVLFMSQAAARVFDARGGAIINISSVGTRIAAPRYMVYSATKAAVQMLTITLSRELGPRGIRVNAVAPGLTDTEMLRKVMSPEVMQSNVDRNTLGRLGRADDIAPVVAFLASDDARWITGETIHVSGGQRG